MELAKRGWQVTGVYIVEKAPDRARPRVHDAGVDMGLVHGDVTDLRRSDVGSDYRLILDTGTFHGLPDGQREAMGREVDAVAAPDATVLLLVWPRRGRPLIRGADRTEIEVAFPGWKITAVEPSFFRLRKPLELVMRPRRALVPATAGMSGCPPRAAMIVRRDAVSGRVRWLRSTRAEGPP